MMRLVREEMGLGSIWVAFLLESAPVGCLGAALLSFPACNVDEYRLNAPEDALQ